jgi:hypothetical protein
MGAFFLFFVAVVSASLAGVHEGSVGTVGSGAARSGALGIDEEEETDPSGEEGKYPDAKSWLRLLEKQRALHPTSTGVLLRDRANILPGATAAHGFTAGLAMTNDFQLFLDTHPVIAAGWSCKNGISVGAHLVPVDSEYFMSRVSAVDLRWLRSPRDEEMAGWTWAPWMHVLRAQDGRALRISRGYYIFSLGVAIQHETERFLIAYSKPLVLFEAADSTGEMIGEWPAFWHWRTNILSRKFDALVIWPIGSELSLLWKFRGGHVAGLGAPWPGIRYSWFGEHVGLNAGYNPVVNVWTLGVNASADPISWFESR